MLMQLALYVGIMASRIETFYHPPSMRQTKCSIRLIRIALNKLFILNLVSYFHLNITETGFCTLELFHLSLEKKMI
jgi:hypothetical protein